MPQPSDVLTHLKQITREYEQLLRTGPQGRVYECHVVLFLLTDIARTAIFEKTGKIETDSNILEILRDRKEVNQT